MENIDDDLSSATYKVWTLHTQKGSITTNQLGAKTIFYLQSTTYRNFEN